METERGSQERFGTAAVLCEAVLYCADRVPSPPMTSRHQQGNCPIETAILGWNCPGHLLHGTWVGPSCRLPMLEQHHWMAEGARRLKDMVLKCGS